jgi:nitrogen fixation protein FixH
MERFDLRDRDGGGVDFSTVTAKLGRPSTTKQDALAELTPIGAGQARADQPLASGQWFADIEVRAENGEVWRKRWRLHVRASGS